MKINIEDINDTTTSQSQIRKSGSSTICFLSIRRCLAILGSLVVVFCVLILFKTYIKVVLIWLESQNASVISCVVCFFFALVSLPVSIGYILLVVSTGYLFGIYNGLVLTIFGANLGLLIAHNILKLLGHYHAIYRFTQTTIAQAIMTVITGPSCFKIVLCARLTPIPFGLQNTIFALSDVSGSIYFIASFLGLLPAQFVGVYVGSTLRSMQDVLENRTITSSTYIFVSLQLLLGASLIIWLGTKARRELLKALAEADNNTNTKVSTYSIV